MEETNQLLWTDNSTIAVQGTPAPGVDVDQSDENYRRLENTRKLEKPDAGFTTFSVFRTPSVVARRSNTTHWI
jgi:hypothetical protein